MKKNQKSLLAFAVVACTLSTSVKAVPFLGFDARSAAMGGAGVASSKVAHSIYFNPSLIANAEENDDFGLLIQAGGFASDEDDMVDSIEDFTDSDVFDQFSDTVDQISSTFSSIGSDIETINDQLDPNNPMPNPTELINAKQSFDGNIVQLNSLAGTDGQLTQNTVDLTDQLNSLSNKAIQAGGGGGVTIAIPSKKFAGAFSVHSAITIAGELTFTTRDSTTVNSYPQALGEYISAINDYNIALSEVEADPGNQTKFDQLELRRERLNTFSSMARTGDDIAVIENGEVNTDVTLTSNAHFIAVGVTDYGLTFARTFNINNYDIAFGATPKIQRIDTYDYIFSLDNDEFEIDDVIDSGETFTSFNLDIGSSYKFLHGTNNVVLGATIKNLFGGEEKTQLGTKIKLNQQVRIGAAYEGSWYTLTSDLDILENKPVAFEDGTQYFGIGGELNVKILQLRAGYRTNMVNSNSVYSVGLGLFNTINVTAYADKFSSDAREIGAVLELDISF